VDLSNDCTLQRLTREIDLSNFYCKEEDLNDFLKNEALDYSKELMGVTHVFTLDSDPSDIVCFFTVSNDVLNLEDAPGNSRNQINRSIPNQKRKLKHYPSVKIGRVGINQKFAGLKIGKQLMEFIKEWFTIGNKTGCRFIIVDAYNKEKVLKYYSDNDFKLLIKEESVEAEHTDREIPLATRFMYFDLKKYIPTRIE
jgi:GNAT superfamily N-acetyltransferase